MNEIPAGWLSDGAGPQDLLNRIHRILTENDEKSLPYVEPVIEGLLRTEPGNDGVVYLYGTYHLHCGRPSIAEQLFRRAIEMKPDAAYSWNNLGVCLHNMGKHEEAMKAYERCLALGGNAMTEMYNNMGSCFINNGTPDEAIKWFEKALELDPENPDAQWNRGLARLEKYEWAQGWVDYEAGLRTGHQSSQKRKRRFEGELPLWRGEPEGLVAIYGEQGVGDEILAASMLEDAAGKGDILYECHPRLVNIMRASFPGFPIYGTRKVPWKTEPLHWRGWHQPVAYRCPIFHLGGLFRNKTEDFPRKPYLLPFEPLVAKHRERLRAMGSRLKIGLSWKGGNETTRKDLRSIGLQHWIPLLQSVDADFISLQYDPADRPGWNTGIIENFEQETGIKLNHWPAIVNDLDECYGGLIHALDLVISANNSLVHACGAFGVPCWTLTPSRPAWRYGITGREMAWYGNHVIQYRQEGDDWTSALNQVKLDLQSLIEERTAA
jgi:tetratricopeptide (TPR) repeat protein